MKCHHYIYKWSKYVDAGDIRVGPSLRDTYQTSVIGEESRTLTQTAFNRAPQTSQQSSHDKTLNLEVM